MIAEYRKRIADCILAERLQSIGAVVVEGAKWCGKTTTCEQIAKSALYIMTLWESGESTGEVSVRRLFDGEQVKGAKSIDYKLDEMAFLVCRSGWPLAVGRTLP